MNSNFVRGGAILCASMIAQNDVSVSGLQIHEQGTVAHKLHSEGIFSAMIDQVTAPERAEAQKHEASQRKQQQLDAAEKDYQAMVQQEEVEEAQAKKKQEEEAENAALEAAKNSPQAKMLAAANNAASEINMSEMEANIQASLQAKLDAGASKNELLMSAGTVPEEPPTNSMAVQSSAQAVVQQVLASHKAPAAPKLVVKPAAAAVVAPAAVASTASSEVKASQDKVKEMAQKLGVPFTNDLLSLGSNSAISDALIEKAVAAGKSEAQINAAMASL